MTEKQKRIEMFTAAALTGLLANHKVTDQYAAHDEGCRGDIEQAAIEIGKEMVEGIDEENDD